MSLDFEVSTIATMTVPDSWRLNLEAPRYSTTAPPVGVTRMSRSVSHPLLRSIHPSPSVLSTPQSAERYRRRSASKDSSNAVNPIQLSASHFHMAQIPATKKMPPIGAAANVRLKKRSKMTESNVQPFEFRGNPVATVTAGNGTVLSCAKHVATALGYSNTRDAIAKHRKGVANRYPLETAGGIQQMVFITEGDVYRLIASSKLPSAVEFEHWLFDEGHAQGPAAPHPEVSGLHSP